MTIGAEVRLSLFALLVIQVISSFASIALLARMGPAIERIIAENEYSVHAAEDMLFVLANCPTGQPCDRAQEFRAALARARSNVTEQAEGPVLREVEQGLGPALSGEPEARKRVMDALRRLAAVNRSSMHQAGASAKRLGVAGAWATVLLGLVGFGVAVVLVRRLARRVVVPVQELDRVMVAVVAGESQRRSQIRDAPPELEELSRGLNQLLDRTVAQRFAATPASGAALDRAVLLHVLDGLAGSYAAVDARERAILAANRRCMNWLSEASDEQRELLLDEALSGESRSLLLRNEAILGGRIRLVAVARG